MNEKNDLRIITASAADVALAGSLFDAYRQFYKYPSDVDGARRFLSARLAMGQSVLYLAFREGYDRPVGLVHLYPTFSSLTLRRQWILSDLFVAPEARKRGIGEALMNRARKLAEETGADALLLETAMDNLSAQRLYERLGYRRDDVFYRYALAVV